MEEDFEIVSHVPVPSPRMKYPFDGMKVGDSFLIHCTEDEKKKRAASVRNAAGRKPEWVFTVRVVDEGVRVWRIE